MISIRIFRKYIFLNLIICDHQFIGRMSLTRGFCMFSKYLFILLASFSIIGAPSLQAYDDSPSCFKEISSDFFSYDILVQALSLTLVPQSQWQLIYSALKIAVKQVPETVKNRANQMNPNPLENPFQPNAADELLTEALLEVFTNVMIANNITNPNNIRNMFSYIREQQDFRIQRCLEKRS